METGFALSEIDTTAPHPARMYDAVLGGCDQPVSGCEPHHVVCASGHEKWPLTVCRADGGHTSLTNLMEACIQPANVTFFEWLGWRPVGGLVSCADIPHQRMLIALAPEPGQLSTVSPAHNRQPC